MPQGIVPTLLLLSACGTAPAPSPAAPRVAAPTRSTTVPRGPDPCTVTQADLDAPDERCMVRYDDRSHPAPDRLLYRIAEVPPLLTTGTERAFTLELLNETGEPIVVPVPAGCRAWEVTAFDERTSTFDSECGGLCTNPASMARYTLLPGGVLRKRVPLSATRRRVSGPRCEEQDLGPLPPGNYTMRVLLPWLDPAPTPDAPDARDHRLIDVPIEVTPRPGP